MSGHVNGPPQQPNNQYYTILVQSFALPPPAQFARCCWLCGVVGGVPSAKHSKQPAGVATWHILILLQIKFTHRAECKCGPVALPLGVCTPP